MITLKNLAPFSNQFEAKGSHTFTHASCQLHVFSLSFDWFTTLPVYFVSGQSDYFDFGSTTLN